MAEVQNLVVAEGKTKAQVEERGTKRPVEESTEIGSANECEHADLSVEERKQKVLRTMGDSKTEQLVIGDQEAGHGKAGEEIKKVNEEEQSADTPDQSEDSKSSNGKHVESNTEEAVKAGDEEAQPEEVGQANGTEEDKLSKEADAAPEKAISSSEKEEIAVAEEAS